MVSLSETRLSPPSFNEEQNQLHAPTSVASYLTEATNDFDAYSLSFIKPKRPEQRAVASTATVNTDRETANVT